MIRAKLLTIKPNSRKSFGVTISAVGASRTLGAIIVIVVVIFMIVAVVAPRILFVIQSATK